MMESDWRGFDKGFDRKLNLDTIFVKIMRNN